MCRMFLLCSKKNFNIETKILKKFISSCHWRYFRKYNIIGHHNLGWGFAYIPENSKKLVIKRDIIPIYRADWKKLTKIKTRFLLVHVRKSYPWKKNVRDIHPININHKYVITHNGIIKNPSFPKLNDSGLEKIKETTELDTRKYLCYILDKIKEGFDLKEALESVFKQIELGIAANAFLFNAKECNIIKRASKKFTGRHRTLFIANHGSSIIVSTTPLSSNAKEIPNNSLIRINLSTLNTKMIKLEI